MPSYKSAEAVTYALNQKAYLNVFDKDDEVEIEIYETETGNYVDTTAVVTVADIQTALGPVLQIDVEANKFNKFL